MLLLQFHHHHHHHHHHHQVILNRQRVAKRNDLTLVHLLFLSHHLQNLLLLITTTILLLDWFLLKSAKSRNPENHRLVLIVWEVLLQTRTLPLSQMLKFQAFYLALRVLLASSPAMLLRPISFLSLTFSPDTLLPNKVPISSRLFSGNPTPFPPYPPTFILLAFYNISKVCLCPKLFLTSFLLSPLI